MARSESFTVSSLMRLSASYTRAVAREIPGTRLLHLKPLEPTDRKSLATMSAALGAGSAGAVVKRPVGAIPTSWKSSEYLPGDLT